MDVCEGDVTEREDTNTRPAATVPPAALRFICVVMWCLCFSREGPIKSVCRRQGLIRKIRDGGHVTISAATRDCGV